MEIGSRLNQYTIKAKLGEGGMGQVFRAEDANLRRDVALKVLPAEVAGNAERMMRLEREAQLLAQVDHANIASVYGLEEIDGVRLLVMQLVDGQDLHARLDAGPMDLEQSLQTALQVARALEFAHERGVIHRDLKPANVMVDDDGRVTLLDFGLAKAFAPDSSGSMPEVSASPTMLEATQAGMILGTAGYMSPEQARGRTVDRRSDIWAFGCLLFEMLTAQRTFGGETVTDVLGAIVHREPDWEALPKDTPPPVRALLARCLNKDVDRRYQAIGDARVAIEEYLEDPEGAGALDAPPAEGPWWRAMLPWGAAAALLVALVATNVDTGPEDESRTMRLDMRLGVTNELRDFSLGSSLIMSPQGNQIAIVTARTQADTTLLLRRLDQTDPDVLVDGGGLYNPFFSPDGNWIGFARPDGLFKVPTTGGTPLPIVEVNRSRGAAWLDDGRVVYARSPSDGLFVVSADGGDPEPLTELQDGERTHRWPQPIAGTRSVLFTAHSEAVGDFAGATIKVVDLDSGEQQVVYRGGYSARYVASGHLLVVSQGTLFAVPFHRVIDTGPYALVRHPGYVGFSLWILATPLLLGSPRAWLPALLSVAGVAVRTALEDRTLRAELDGYREYAKRVRYRWIPGVW